MDPRLHRDDARESFASQFFIYQKYIYPNLTSILLNILLKNIITTILKYALPYRCIVCRELVDERVAACPSCWKELSFISRPYCITCGTPFQLSIHADYSCGKCLARPPEYDLARSVFKFDQASKKIIHAFKYNDKTIYAELFARLIYTKYKDDFGHIDLIVPVPMHRLKRLYRYYNQSQLLAGELAKLAKVKVIPDILLKVKLTKSQVGLSQSDRKKNLLGSIKYNKKYTIKDKYILLVDDVHTTGVTTNMCAKILKQNGARGVRVSTIAMT